jgi:hypothetical protein
MRAGDIVDNKDFWVKMFQETDLADHIEKKYKMSMGPIMEEEAEE